MRKVRMKHSINKFYGQDVLSLDERKNQIQDIEQVHNKMRIAILLFSKSKRYMGKGKESSRRVLKNN